MSKPKKYTTDTKKFSELQNKITIPKFQRGLVWSEKKKQSFIHTLKEGLPIGVLLLAKDGDDKYLIVDGLQRFSTMIDYSNNIFKYVSKDEITYDSLVHMIYLCPSARAMYDSFTAEAKTKVSEEIRSIIVDKIKNRGNQNTNTVSTEITKELCQKTSIFSKEETLEIQGGIYSIVSEIEKDADISEIEIPLIIFTGQDHELVEIFQKLNQEGVKLSKYDVFAATWINDTVTVKNDEEFIDYIIQKYDEAQNESDLDIAFYDRDELKQSGELTVYEYAFALGKALMKECNKLFSKADKTSVDSIGFLILAELMGLTYQKMDDLAKTIKKYPAVDFKKLKDAILQAGSVVQSALTPYIESPSKPKKGNKRTSLACHSELQIASFIIVVFKLMYELSPSKGLVENVHKKDLQNVKKFMYKHYLYDILRGFWSGTGDKKLEDIIADPTTCRYTRDVAKDEFQMILNAWLDESNSKPSSVNVSAETKLFLNYLLRLSIPDADKHSYDVEHCVPKDVIKKYYHKKKIPVPMSTVCNLIYIPTKDNRSKGEKTYYQRQSDDPGTFTLNQTQLDNLGYPKKYELQFVNSTSTLTQAEYNKYLGDRKNYLSNRMITLLFQ